jgi:competence protein ComEC
VNKASAIDVVAGHHAVLHADTMAVRDPYFQQDLQSARDLYAVTTSVPPGDLSAGFPFISGHHQTWLYVGKTFRLHKSGRIITLNGVILGNHPDIDPVTLTRYFRFPVIVFDNSIPLWKIQRWKKQADSLHLRHHSVFEQGAWETDL